MSKTSKYKKPNALKHGVFAAAAILPGEDPREFHDLHAALIAEWAPDGTTENEFVITMAQAAWAKRRRQKHSEVGGCLRTCSILSMRRSMKISVSVAWRNFLQTEPETAFQAYAGRLLRPARLQNSSGNFQLQISE